MKVDGKPINTGDVTIERHEFKLIVSSKMQIEKFYLKDLTKKYLYKKRLQDWIHVVGQKKNSLKLSYFRMTCWTWIVNIE